MGQLLDDLVDDIIMNTVLQFGYSSPGSKQLIDHYMKQKDILLVDIRYSTQSRHKPYWSESNLRTLYGDRYVHIQDLGNEHYFQRELGIKIHNIENGLDQLEIYRKQSHKIILLCTCIEYATCHRKIVIDALKERMKHAK